MSLSLSTSPSWLPTTQTLGQWTQHSSLWQTCRNVYTVLFYDFFRKHVPMLILYILLCFITFFIQILVVPKILAEAIKTTPPSASSFSWLHRISQNMKWNPLWLRTCAYPFFIFLSLIVLFFFKSRIDAYLPIEHMKYVREYLFRSILQSHQMKWKTISIGIFMSRYNALPREARYFGENVLAFWPVLFLVLFMMGFLLCWDRLCFFIFIVTYFVLGCLFWWTPLGSQCLQKAYHRAQRMLWTTDKMAQEIQNLDHIYINQQETQSLEENHQRERHLSEQFQDTASFNNQVIFLGTLGTLITFYLILYRSYSLLSQKQSSSRSTGMISFSQFFLTFTFFQSTMLTFLPRLVSIIQGFMTLVVYYQSISSLSTSSPVSSPLVPTELWTFPHYSISFQNVSFSYPSSSTTSHVSHVSNVSHVLRHVQWMIPAGQKVIILAPSGSGKSTLFKLLFRFYSPSTGQIQIGSYPLNQLDIAFVRSHIAYLSQTTHLFGKSILDNILYGNEHLSISEKQVLHVVSMYHFDRILGKDLSQPCGYEGKEISSGMQKIVLLLRCFWKWKTSRILLLDEPFAGLDPETRKNVSRLLMDHVQPFHTCIISNHLPLDSLGLSSSFLHRVMSWKEITK